MSLTKRTYARIAGLSILLMAVAAGYAYGYVYSSLVIKENPVQTIENVSASLTDFIGGIIGWIVIFVLDVLAAWGLYKLFQTENSKLSAIMSVLRLVYALVLGVAIAQLVAVVGLVDNSADSLLIMETLGRFETIWSLGLILFGIHLFYLGILVGKSKSVTHFFASPLIFAGVCYSGIHLSKVLLTSYMAQIDSIETILAIPMALAEIGFAVWLLIKGGKAS